MIIFTPEQARASMCPSSFEDFFREDNCPIIGYIDAEVESHQPLPEHQHVSSGGVFRRKDRTFLKSPRLNATVNFNAVSSSRAPAQGMNAAGHTNRAS